MELTSEQKAVMHREIGREVYRSSLLSIFWAVIQARKRRKEGFRIQSIADHLKVDKAVVSRWFSGRPNWRANSVSDIAEALNIELRITAYDRTDGTMYGPSGKIVSTPTSTSENIVVKGHEDTVTSTLSSGTHYMSIAA